MYEEDMVAYDKSWSVQGDAVLSKNDEWKSRKQVASTGSAVCTYVCVLLLGYTSLTDDHEDQ